MCLITFAYRAHPRYSLILAANRDEFFQRPSTPVQYWEDYPDILAGRDQEQGGTWLGLNKLGQFATVTNFRNGRDRRTDLRSRGHLTARYLQDSTTAQAYLQALQPTQQSYGAFNLLLGDQDGLHYLSNRSNAEATRLKPGVYGLSNALLDTPWPKLQHVKEGLRDLIAQPQLSPEDLLSLMQDTTPVADTQLPDTGISLEWERLLSTCFIRSASYGTRAISLLLQQPDGTTEFWEHSFTEHEAGETRRYTLQLPPIGGTAAS